MTGPRTAAAIRFLHWVVGLIVLYDSYRTFDGAFAVVHSSTPPTHLTWVRLLLSGAEIAAASLFLFSWSSIAGAYFLEGIFAVAIATHTLHGDFTGLEFLVFYAAAVYVVLASKKEGSTADRLQICHGQDPNNLGV